MLGDGDVLTSSVTQEQGMTDQYFQLANLLAHRGLGSMHAFGGTGEAAFIDHADEGLEQFKIKHGDLLDI
jgi:hypothetical protein